MTRKVRESGFDRTEQIQLGPGVAGRAQHQQIGFQQASSFCKNADSPLVGHAAEGEIVLVIDQPRQASASDRMALNEHALGGVRGRENE